MDTSVRTARWRRPALLLAALAVALGTVAAAPAALAEQAPAAARAGVPMPAAGVPAAAAALPAATPPPASTLGGPSIPLNCPVRIYATSVWGWCDGTGPERYRIYAYCTDGRPYGSSATPWFGDRRGAWAYCPSGSYASRAFWDYA